MMRLPKQSKSLACAAVLLGLVLLAAIGPTVGHAAFGAGSAVTAWLDGARRSVLEGTVAGALSAVIGCGLAGLAVVGPGFLDGALARAAQWTGALPSVVVVFALCAVTASHGALAFAAAIAVVRGVGAAWVLRTSLSTLAREEYVLAARALGSGSFRLFRTHLFPPLAGLAASQAAFTLTTVVALEAATAFLGLDTVSTSFGTLLSGAAERHSATAALSPLFGVAAIVLPVQAVGLHVAARARVGRRFS